MKENEELKEKLDKKTTIENEQWLSDFFNNAMNGFILIEKSKLWQE